MYKSLIGNIFAAIRKTGIKKSGSAALPPPLSIQAIAVWHILSSDTEKGRVAEMFLENFSIISILSNHNL